MITQSVCASELTISMIFTHASLQRSRPGWGSMATSVQLIPIPERPAVRRMATAAQHRRGLPQPWHGSARDPRCNKHRGPMAESNFTRHHQSCSASDGPRTRCSQSCPENTTANPECQRRSFRSHHGPDPVHRAQPNGTTLTESALALGTKQHAPAEIRGVDRHRSPAGRRFAPHKPSAPNRPPSSKPPSRFSGTRRLWLSSPMVGG